MYDIYSVIDTASLKYILFAKFVVCMRCVCALENLSVCMMSVFRRVGGWVLLVYGWVGGINTLEFASAHTNEWWLGVH